ncbi:IS3 family transposase [Streptomyces diastaticus]|uniref:IS3 family transposase n=1 Tax=Streptomyces diastaticus TaxID=1956 RepID=UPI0036623793
MTSRWRFISDHHLEYGIQRLCRIFRVSRSGFYRWRTAAPARRERAEAEMALTEQIQAIQGAAKGAYGVPRITRELRETGPVVNHKRVARLMRMAGIAGRHLRKGKRTTVQDARAPKAPDLLERDFTAPRPNVQWCGDIRYLPVGKDWMYLATVIDIHSRRVVGWSTAEHLRADLVIDALEAAVATRGGSVDGVIFHSDRGTQLRFKGFSSACRRHGIRRSMGRVGSSYDKPLSSLGRTRPGALPPGHSRTHRPPHRGVRRGSGEHPVPTRRRSPPRPRRRLLGPRPLATRHESRPTLAAAFRGHHPGQAADHQGRAHRPIHASHPIAPPTHHSVAGQKAQPDRDNEPPLGSRHRRTCPSGHPPTHPTAALAVLTGTQSDIAVGTLDAVDLTVPATPSRAALPPRNPAPADSGTSMERSPPRGQEHHDRPATPTPPAPHSPGAGPTAEISCPALPPELTQADPGNAVRHVPPASAIRNATARTSAIPISRRPSLTCTSTTSPNIHIDTHRGTPIRGTPHLATRGLRSTTFPPLGNFTETGKRYPEM